MRYVPSIHIIHEGLGGLVFFLSDRPLDSGIAPLLPSHSWPMDEDLSPPVVIDGKEHVTPRQAAAIKQCSLRTIRYWMSKKRLPYVHDSQGRVRIPLDQLETVARERNPQLNDCALPLCPDCGNRERGAYERHGRAVAICDQCGLHEFCPPDHYLTKLLAERNTDG